YRCTLFERSIARFQGYPALTCKTVLCVSGVGYAVYFVSWFELSYVISYCLYYDSEISAQSGLFWPADSHAYSKQGPDKAYHERSSSHVMLVCGIHGGRIDFYQYSTYFVRSWFLHVLDLENVW